MKRLLQAVKRVLSPSEDLTSQTVIGGVWAALTNGGGQVLQILKIVVLARLLSPADFGLFGIALLVMTALRRFSRLGFDTALIQNKEDNVNAYLDTVFSLQILRGMVIAGVAFFAAPLVAAFFNEPRAELLVRVIALATLFRMFYNPGTVYFEKDLEFHKRFVFVLSGSVVQVVVSISYALIDPTVWALAAGLLASNGAQLVVSYLIHGYRPWPRFDRERAAELVGYGKWIFGSSAVSFFYSEGDDIFVGRVLGSDALGVYQLAYRLSNAPATEIAHTISRVAMPAYSKVQDDTAALREGFHRVLQFSSLASIPIGVGIFVVAPVFVPTVLGDGWGAMVRPMQVLAVFGVLRSIRTSTTPLFRAVGRPDYPAKIHALRLCVMIVTIWPLTDAFGLVGTALSVLLTSALGIPIATFLAIRIVDDDLRSLAVIVGVPALGSLLMGVSAYAVRQFVTQTAGMFPALVATILTGVVAYGVAILSAERYFHVGLRDFVGQVRQSL